MDLMETGAWSFVMMEVLSSTEDECCCKQTGDVQVISEDLS